VVCRTHPVTLALVQNLVDRKDQDVNAIATGALELGEIITEGRIKFEWEKDALHDRKVRAGNSRGGKTTKRETVDWIKASRECEALHPDWAPYRVAHHIAIHIERAPAKHRAIYQAILRNRGGCPSGC
jgi:hypothetical protein